MWPSLISRQTVGVHQGDDVWRVGSRIPPSQRHPLRSFLPASPPVRRQRKVNTGPTPRTQTPVNRYTFLQYHHHRRWANSRAPAKSHTQELCVKYTVVVKKTYYSRSCVLWLFVSLGKSYRVVLAHSGFFIQWQKLYLYSDEDSGCSWPVGTSTERVGNRVKWYSLQGTSTYL